MLIEKTLNTKHRQAGMTLIELMVSIVLGLLLLGAATAMTVSSMVMNGDTLQSARLNQDLDSVLHIMVNDVRRAGFSGGVSGFFKVTNEDLYLASDNSCVLYSYDADENEVLEDTEKFGFKRVEVSSDPVIYEIEMRTSCDAGDDCAIDCGEGEWVALTDSGVIAVTNLAFDAVNSKCLNITREVDDGNNFWIATKDGATQVSCLEDEDDEGNRTNYIIDEATGAYVVFADDFAPLADGDRLIAVRQVNIEIEAELKNDPSMIKRQSVAVNVRNNRVSNITPP